MTCHDNYMLIQVLTKTVKLMQKRIEMLELSDSHKTTHKSTDECCGNCMYSELMCDQYDIIIDENQSCIKNKLENKFKRYRG